MQEWIEEMAPHVKALAPKQLLAFGGEGFLCAGQSCANFSSSAPSKQRSKADVMAAKKQTDVWEPVAGREGDHEALHHANYIMSRLGGNFAANNAVDALDVATYSADFAEVRHVLQDLGVEGWAASLDVWTRLHEEAAAALGKPLILESFGPPPAAARRSRGSTARSSSATRSTSCSTRTARWALSSPTSACRRGSPRG